MATQFFGAFLQHAFALIQKLHELVAIDRFAKLNGHRFAIFFLSLGLLGLNSLLVDFFSLLFRFGQNLFRLFFQMAYDLVEAVGLCSIGLPSNGSCQALRSIPTDEQDRLGKARRLSHCAGYQR
ncbi:MAG: hypothetical protein ACR2NM_01645 [Bythopirellula sp.]